MKTVIYHSADFDGLFCREIAKKLLGTEEVTYIGWDFKDEPLKVPPLGDVIIMDLPVDRVFGFNFEKPVTVIEVFGDVPAMKEFDSRLTWIDHHKTSIDTHPKEIKGYRIDGVAACRLAWQWFTYESGRTDGRIFPIKQDFIDRIVYEPYAVRLAGEYDIWDKRDPLADTFQYALRVNSLEDHIWKGLLDMSDCGLSIQESQNMAMTLMRDGHAAQKYAQQTDASTMGRSYLLKWEGLTFLALNTARCNSITFASKDVPETGHDALMGYYFDGQKVNVSMYHAKHRMDLDLSAIAKKHGGGGHRGACGMQLTHFPV